MVCQDRGRSCQANRYSSQDSTKKRNIAPTKIRSTQVYKLGKPNILGLFHSKKAINRKNLREERETKGKIQTTCNEIKTQKWYWGGSSGSHHFRHLCHPHPHCSTTAATGCPRRPSQVCLAMTRTQIRSRGHTQNMVQT